MVRQTSIRAYNNEVKNFKNKLYPKILETENTEKTTLGRNMGNIKKLK